MRAIDADALIDDLKHDVAMDQDSLDYEELTDSNREKIQFDKDCKQNAIDLLRNAPTIEPEIVRCKDCEYGKQDEVGRWFCWSLGCQIGDEDGSGYCADAERRADDQSKR